jgi:hypothetical protein
MPVGQCVARCSNFAPTIHRNCHRLNIGAIVAVREIGNFVLGLSGLFPIEPDLIGTAKNCSADSP